MEFGKVYISQSRQSTKFCICKSVFLKKICIYIYVFYIYKYMYLFYISRAQLAGVGGGSGGALLYPVWKIEKNCPGFGKKVLLVCIYGLTFIWKAVFRASWRKNTKIFTCRALRAWNIYRSAPIPTIAKNLPCSKKFLATIYSTIAQQHNLLQYNEKIYWKIYIYIYIYIKNI